MVQIGFRRFAAYQTKSEMELHFWNGENVTEHTHKDFFEFAICTHGKIEQTINKSEQVVLRKKDIVMFHPGDSHLAKSIGQTKESHINITAKEQLIYEICAMFKLPQEQIINFKRKIRLSDAEYSYLCDAAEKSLSIDLDENEEIYELLVKNIIINLINIFLRKGLNKNEIIPEWLQIFVDKVSLPEYFCRPIKELYEVAGYSQPTISVYFRKYYQKSFVKFLTEKKIAYACSLLRNSNYLVITIANMSGFSTLSHFNQTFKDIVGMSPSDYREYF